MNFCKIEWNKTDFLELNAYLKNLGNKEKVAWSRNILRTNYELFVIPSKTLRDIARQIHKGNFVSFLENTSFDNYEQVMIYCYLLNTLKDFETIQKYLEIYMPHIDCWSLCDSLKIQNKNCEKKLFDLAKTYTKSDKTYVKRVGLKIMFSYTTNKDYTEEIFNTLNSFYNESEYYVNMIVAWLFCEMFIKQNKETKDFLKTHKLSNFVINKGIQKCRDSYRVSDTDKTWLLQFKK